MSRKRKKAPFLFDPDSEDDESINQSINQSNKRRTVQSDLDDDFEDISSLIPSKAANQSNKKSSPQIAPSIKQSKKQMDQSSEPVNNQSSRSSRAQRRNLVQTFIAFYLNGDSSVKSCPRCDMIHSVTASHSCNMKSQSNFVSQFLNNGAETKHSLIESVIAIVEQSIDSIIQSNNQSNNWNHGNLLSSMVEVWKRNEKFVNCWSLILTINISLAAESSKPRRSWHHGVCAVVSHNRAVHRYGTEIWMLVSICWICLCLIVMCSNKLIRWTISKGSESTANDFYESSLKGKDLLSMSETVVDQPLD